ncbi:hypothetical protein, partial [Escherichia coli]|uniref:hypothetical protein n=1 Tax=Escherichia coli TaxID=562 RepID=UPI002FBF01BF
PLHPFFIHKKFFFWVAAPAPRVSLPLLKPPANSSPKTKTPDWGVGFFEGSVSWGTSEPW